MSARSLAFVVPCHGREQLAGACLRQLRRTCDELAADGLDATAVLVGDEPVFERVAAELVFEFVRQANSPLGRKWNDGFEAALALGAEFVIPFGSDDAVDARLIAERLPGSGAIGASRMSAIVAPDGKRLAHLKITYEGGDGVRTWPAGLLQHLDGRPCEDERERALDTSMHRRLRRAHVQAGFRYVDLHPLQILDFKSTEGQLNPYDGCVRGYGVGEFDDVWQRIAEVYPVEFVDEVERIYAGARS